MTSQAAPHPLTIIGRNIAAARASKGITQRELAAKVGVDSRAPNRWERGGIVPRPDHLVKIAEALDRDPGWFYTDHGFAEEAA
jgi:transcriptional regulator with XRE-family HTH domain